MFRQAAAGFFQTILDIAEPEQLKVKQAMEEIESNLLDKQNGIDKKDDGAKFSANQEYKSLSILLISVVIKILIILMKVMSSQITGLKNKKINNSLTQIPWSLGQVIRVKIIFLYKIITQMELLYLDIQHRHLNWRSLGN